jgi:hypothetical protein
MSNPTPVSEKVAQHLLYLEQSLLSPSARRDRDRVAGLLAEDFVEFGTSGKTLNREQVLALLGGTEEFEAPQIEDLKCRAISEGVVLVTYRTVRTNETGRSFVTLRSSIWSLHSGFWLLRFHQGTLAR